MRKPLIAGNWKMYKTISEAIAFARSVRSLVVNVTHCDILIAPPFTALRSVADRLEGSNIGVESVESVHRKVQVALRAGLTPVVCVGELLQERDAGRAEEVVGRQLGEGLKNLTLEDAFRIITAYEPVWAIGTGRTATPETAEQMHSYIRSHVRDMFGDSVADRMRILYGGSVKPDNISALMEKENLDGALVGGASLDVDSFVQIVNYLK